MQVDQTVDEAEEEEEDVNRSDIKEIGVASECSLSLPELETLQQQHLRE